MGEDHSGQPYFFAIQNHGMILEYALLAKALDAAPAGRLGQPDALADAGRVDAGFALQEIEDFAIGGVQ